MALPSLRPLAARACCWRTLLQHNAQVSIPAVVVAPLLQRSMATDSFRSKITSRISTNPNIDTHIPIHTYDIHPTRRPTPGSFHGNVVLPPPKKIPVHAPPPAPPKEVLSILTSQAIKTLDPASQKSKLFSRTKEGLRVGDIIQVRFRNKDPFSGVLIDLRRRGVDSSILLRNQLTRVGVEMWIKLYSPLVAGVDIVQRARKRARRARLYFMRDPKHDFGSVQNIVAAYMKQRALLRSGGAKNKGAAAGGKPHGKKK